jgi:hypothetical protein
VQVNQDSANGLPTRLSARLELQVVDRPVIAGAKGLPGEKLTAPKKYDVTEILIKRYNMQRKTVAAILSGPHFFKKQLCSFTNTYFYRITINKITGKQFLRKRIDKIFLYHSF